MCVDEISLADLMLETGLFTNVNPSVSPSAKTKRHHYFTALTMAPWSPFTKSQNTNQPFVGGDN